MDELEHEFRECNKYELEHGFRVCMSGMYELEHELHECMIRNVHYGNPCTTTWIPCMYEGNVRTGT